MTNTVTNSAFLKRFETAIQKLTYQHLQKSFKNVFTVCTAYQHDNLPAEKPTNNRLTCQQQSQITKLSTTVGINYCLQCFDTVGWASGRASGLQKLSDGVLVWLSV